VGLYTQHIGILILIFSSFVTRHFAWEGNMALRPGMQSSEALHYRNWNLEILPIDREVRGRPGPHYSPRSVGAHRLEGCADLRLPGSSLRHPHHPCCPQFHADPGFGTDVVPIRCAGGGWFQADRSFPRKRRRNATPPDSTRILSRKQEETRSAPFSGRTSAGILLRSKPFTFEMDGKKWAAQVVRERMQIPFTIKLDQFLFEKYAGVMTAKNYQSNITKIENDTEEKIEVKMNEPFRHRGYTFFQAQLRPPGSWAERRALHRLYRLEESFRSLAAVFSGDHLRRSPLAPRLEAL